MFQPLTSLFHTGQSIGNVMTLTLSGLMCDIPVQGGWPFIFYIFCEYNEIIIYIPVYYTTFVFMVPFCTSSLYK